jgi:hypothetical protein
MQTIDPSQTFMKLLTSALLLAAATATQLQATDFTLTYAASGGSVESNASATGTIGIDTTLLPNPGFSSSNSAPAWITSFTLTISGMTGVDSNLNGTYTLADFTRVEWSSQSSIDLSAEIVGQSGFRYFSYSLRDRMNGPHEHGFITGSTLYSDSHDLALELTSFILAGPSGVADFADWMSSVNNQNRVYTAGTTLASLPLEGAHHRPMMSFDRMGKDAQFWATGDFGSSSRVRDVKLTSGEMGVNKDIGPNTLAGIAIGRGQQNQNLALEGSNNVIGNYVLGEIDYRPFGSQWIVSLLGMIGSWDAKINRGYSNSGSTDFSFGQTDIISRSARLRVDAPVLFSVGGFGFSPYASYAVTQTVVEAYTEAGGALPASYDEQKHNATEARLGMMATKVFDEKLKLIVSVEGIHRFDGAGPALTGQDITGSVGFSLPGQAPRPDCVRLGVDVDYKLAADTLLNVSAHASTVGEVADVSGAVSIRRAF